MEMTKQIFSVRVIKKNLHAEDVVSIQHTLRFFNEAKIKTYRYWYEKEINGIHHFGKQSEHLFVKNRYNTDDYYANSIVQESKGIFKGQNETHKLNQQNLENKIKTAEKKAKTLEKQIQNKEKIVESIVKFSKGKTKKIAFYKGAIEGQKKDLFTVRLKKKTLIFYHLYDFEHRYLKPNIEKLKNRLYRIREKIHRLKMKAKKLEKGCKGATFGGKKTFKSQFTIPHYRKNHKRWKKDFEQKRYFCMQISGRKDAKYGNFVFKYIPETKTLHFHTHEGKPIVIENLEFPYGQDWLDDAIHHQKERKKPIAWKIEDYGEYYLFKATLSVQNNHLNYSKSDGVVSYDKNVDHIAWTEVNKEGNLIDQGVIPFELEGKTTGQASKILEKAAIELVSIAERKKKSLAGEEIDTTKSKSTLHYGNKRRNKKITQFAYNKMDSSIESRACKQGIALFKTNPAYTSQIGKIKYMKQKGLSIHVSAAYVIGRRVLKKKDKLPKELKRFLSDKQIIRHHWSHWNYISKTLKEVKPHFFYPIDSKQQQLKASKDLKEYKMILEQ